MPIAATGVSADSDGHHPAKEAIVRKSLRLLVLALASVLAALVLPAPAQAAAPYCGITWGSLAKSAGTTTPTSASLTDVRAGQHDCYDRLVIDLANAPGWASYSVRYATVSGVGSGIAIPLVGDGDLLITLRAHGESLTFPDSDHIADVTGFRTFRQVASGGSLEGVTVLGLGVRARLPFRAFVLDGPGAGHERLVIDVAHAW